MAQTTNKIVMLPIEWLHPHPDNPRRELGDLTELADSIRECGVYQNLTVVRGHRMSREEWATLMAVDGTSWDDALGLYDPSDCMSKTEYTVIIGHRRLAAAKLAGLEELPCSVVEMDDEAQFRTMLIENMQREDLTVYEQAQGFQMMMDFGDTEAGIAKKTGFSKTTVRKRLEIAKLDQAKLKEVTEDPERQITMAALDKLSQIDDVDERNSCLQKIGTKDYDFAVKKAVMEQQIAKGTEYVMPTIKAAKLKKLAHSDTYGDKYSEVKYVSIMKPELVSLDDLIPDVGEKKIFYFINDWDGRLRFFIQKEKPKPTKRPQAEIDREKKAAEANAKMDALEKTCYELRKSFAEEIRGTPAMFHHLVRGALLIGTFAHVSYLPSEQSSVMRGLGLPTEWRETKLQEAIDVILKAPVGDFPRLIYLMLGDRPDNGYSTEYQKMMPEHRKNEKLDAIYRFLCSLGYEMSEQEKQLQDGSHRLFHLNDKEAAE